MSLTTFHLLVAFIAVWAFCALACAWTRNEKPLHIAFSVTIWGTLVWLIWLFTRGS